MRTVLRAIAASVQYGALTAHPPAPAPAIVELDGWSLEPLTEDDAPLVVELMGIRGHRYLLDLAADESSMRLIIAELARQTWAMPMAAIRDDACAGFMTTAFPNLRSLNVGVGGLFVDPALAVLPFAMYVRHLFWSYPLHRLHAQIPDMDLTREYHDLFAAVGFTDEGRLVQHSIAGGQMFDMVQFGILRPDFEAWTAAHEPRLALAT